MPLKLSLKPGERFVLNGAVVENGDRRSTLVLQNKASVLREKDIMQMDDASTPARRIYFPIMMMYLDEDHASDYFEEFSLRIGEFMGVIRSAEILSECVTASKHVLAREYYKGLMACRKLIEYEDESWPMSLRAYQSAAQRVEDPRQAEYRLFGEVTRALMEAAQSPTSDVQGRMRALDWNRRLWTALASDCANDDNALPVTLRASIISLNLWVSRHTSAVARREEAIEPLIEVNRIVMQGLEPRPQAA